MKYMYLVPMALYFSGVNACCIDDLMRTISARNYTQAMRLVYARIINLNTQWGPEEITPLIAAVNARQIPLVHSLLEHGADPNVQDIQGRTALAYINYINGNEDDVTLFKLLRSYGANVNIRDVKGRTPLWILASGFCDANVNLIRFAQLFLNYGCDIGLCDMYGMTIVDYAKLRSKVKDVFILASLFIQAIQNNDAVMMRSLLKMEPNLIGVKYSGKTTIELAQNLGRFNAIAVLNEVLLLSAKASHNS